MAHSGTALLGWLASLDPAPLFVLSLVPYLAFLWWTRRVRGFPRLAWAGFAFTLVFVAGTIAGSIVAASRYGARLMEVEALHGGAEALLSISNVLVLLGFQRACLQQSRRSPLIGADPHR
jgi:hypothetical protein